MTVAAQRDTERLELFLLLLLLLVDCVLVASHYISIVTHYLYLPWPLPVPIPVPVPVRLPVRVPVVSAVLLCVC